VAYIAPAHPPRDLAPRNVSRRRFELACECAERVVDLHSPSGDFLYAYGQQVGYMVQKETGTPARSSAALPTDLAPQTPSPAGKCSSRHSVARRPTVENAARPVGHITPNNTLLSARRRSRFLRYRPGCGSSSCLSCIRRSPKLSNPSGSLSA
jgi:hypothetical protein